MSMRRKQIGRLSGVLILAASASGCTTQPVGDGAGSRRLPPVFLLEVDQLSPPAVGRAQAFTPDFVADIDDSNAHAGQYVAFFLTVATADGDALKIREVNRTSGSVSSFVRVDRPSFPDQADEEMQLSTLSGRMRQILASGEGLYWIGAPGGTDGMPSRRIAVMLPQSHLTPAGSFEVYTSTAPDGTPIGGDTFELVREFFYMAVLGDSLSWGNGLNQRDKFSSLVAHTIELETGAKVITQMLAQSGAQVVPGEADAVCRSNCWGEVPTASTSVTTQAGMIERPDLVELILVGGCVNDVGLGVILDPETRLEELTAATQQFCGDEMTGLLTRIQQLAPQSRIVLFSYYPAVGPGSDIFGLEQWLQVEEVEVDEEIMTLKASLIDNATTFDSVCRESMATAVNNANAAEAGEARIAFASVPFGPDNAVFTADNWLWSMNGDSELLAALGLNLLLFPEDPIVEQRMEVCGEEGVVPDLIGCLYSSVGHPNPQGARAYADAIVEALRELGVLAPETP